MIAKEKVIFWTLLPMLISTIVIGFNMQEKKKQSSEAFLKDIESVTEKAKAKKKTVKDNWDIEGLKKQDTLKDYPALTERDIFFRPVSEVKEETRREIAPLKKEEEPEKPVFLYKGRMMLGAKVIVIIEDQNTGKSFSVKEGDAAGDFTVLSVDEKEIRLKSGAGEEIVISTVKEEKKDEKKEALGGPEGINEKK